jgi:hypothetical protein
MVKTLITHVAKLVQSQASLAEIRAKVQQYLDDHNIAMTPEQWARDHYKLLRKWAFPPYDGFIDAYAPQISFQF